MNIQLFTEPFVYNLRICETRMNNKNINNGRLASALFKLFRQIFLKVVLHNKSQNTLKLF